MKNIGLLSVVLSLAMLFLSGCESPNSSTEMKTKGHLHSYGHSGAVLIYFYNNDDPLCQQQLPIVQQFAARHGAEVTVIGIDCLYIGGYGSDNARFTTFFDVHNVPQFILKKRDEVYYHRAVGPLDARQLEAFVRKAMAEKPTPETQKGVKLD